MKKNIIPPPRYNIVLNYYENSSPEKQIGLYDNQGIYREFGVDKYNIDRWIEYSKKYIKQDKKNLIGITSNCLIKIPKIKIRLEELKGTYYLLSREYHNLFLEWDNVDIDYLKKLFDMEGLIISTGRGYHFIQENCLSLNELHKYQKKYNCCSGYINMCHIRKRAMLRITPKEGRKLKIIKDEQGEYYDIYKKFLKAFND